MHIEYLEDLIRDFYQADHRCSRRRRRLDEAQASYAQASDERKAAADRLKGVLAGVKGTVSLPVGCNSHVVWDGHVLRVSSGMTAADVLRLQPKPETPPVADAVTDDDDCGEDAPTGFAATY